jgi:hypothetical protein
VQRFAQKLAVAIPSTTEPQRKESAERNAQVADDTPQAPRLARLDDQH